MMIIRLEALKLFNDNLSKLVEYKAKHGSCNILPSADKNLFEWTERLKSMQHVLPAKQSRQLEEMGFEFQPQKDAWESIFRQLSAYKKKYGHCYINAQEPEYEHLYHWTELQKQSKRFLKQDQVKRLDDLGFDWEPLGQRDSIWNFRFEELKAYKLRFGDCLVPENWKENPTLAHFVSHQRKTRIKIKNRKVISPERKTLLDGIGFIWEVDWDTKTRKSWDENYKELVKFKEKFGHTNVPMNYKGPRSLYHWVIAQRSENKLPLYRKEKLEQIGFIFKEEFANLLEEKWEQKFSELVAFKRKFGHCNVPRKGKKWKKYKEYNEFKNLNAWVNKQKLRPITLTKERIRKLQSIGFRFYETDLGIVLSSWNEMYGELLKFKKEHGHPNVPHDYTENNPLRNWVNRIRTKIKGLPEAKIKMLKEIGFDFKGYFHWRNQNVWNQRFEKLKLFHQKFGHCNVPESNQEFRELSFWVSNIRRGKSKLPKDRIRLLNELGFEWSRKKKAQISSDLSLKSKRRQQGKNKTIEQKNKLAN